MATAPSEAHILLGCGGSRPGVVLAGIESRAVRDVLTLEAGASVYAVDMDCWNGVIAAGTRAGHIYILDECVPTDGQGGTEVVRLAQGAPVLSVCLAGPGRLASTDAAGRCLLWRELAPGAVPQALETTGAAVLGLTRLGADDLGGVSREGMFLIWRLSDGSLLRRVPVPRPGAIGALVRVRWWPADGSLVFPGARGELIRYRLEEDVVHTVEAHEGGFYAMGIANEALISLGENDGLYKYWLPGKDRPTRTGRASCGTTSCALLDEDGSQLLCVSRHGEARCYRVGEDRLEPEHELSGRHYRVAGGPPADALKRLRQRREAQEASRLRGDAEQALSVGDEASARLCLGGLEGLGYGHVAAALRADDARRREDPVAEVAARKRLFELVPMSVPKCRHSLERYVELLDAYWQVDEACGACAGLEATGGEYCGAGALREKAKAIQEGNWVIQPDVPLRVVIEVASGLGKPFAGRLVLHVLSASPCPSVSFDSATLAGKYEELRRQDANGRLPEARRAMTWWLARDEVQQVDTASFAGSGMAEGLELAVQVRNDGVHTVVTPTVLFVAASPSPGVEASEHNRQMLRRLGQVEHGAAAEPWLSGLHEALRVTVGRLVNAGGQGLAL